MQNAINTVMGMWKVYWGDGYLGYLSIACYIILVILCIFKKKFRSIAVSSGILAALFLCPFTLSLLVKMVGDTYWRGLWTIPFIMIIAIVFTTAASVVKKKWLHFCILIAAILVIAFSGSTQLSTGRFVKLHNPERVPDDIVSIAELLNEEKTTPWERIIAANSTAVSFLRVYDPSIRLAYGRGGEGAYDVNLQTLAALMDYPVDDNLQTIAELANSERITHLIMNSTSTESDDMMLEEGWERKADIGQYVVYRKISS